MLRHEEAPPVTSRLTSVNRRVTITAEFNANVDRDGERHSEGLALVSGLCESLAKFGTVALLPMAKVELAADGFGPVDDGNE